MTDQFEIKSDFEFYCYLKAHLPSTYRIEAEPSSAYLSEWQYHYKVFHKEQLVKEYQGSFREIKKGSLIHEAQQLLSQIGDSQC